MDCTLKVIAGPDSGQEFVCAGAETYVGRSQRCAVRLSSPGVSFEHALVTRAGDEFHIENLSANGTLLNNQKLTSKTRLKPRDQIRLAETVLRVERVPATPGSGSASRRVLLLVVLLVMLLGGAWFLIADPFSPRTDYDWPRAYNSLSAWVDDAAARGDLPANMPTLLHEAWRLENASNRGAARTAWLRLHVALTDYETRTPDAETAVAAHRTALSTLLLKNPAPELSDEELLAALHQFVVQMEHRK